MKITGGGGGGWGGGGLLLIPIDYTGTVVFRSIWSEKGLTFCLRGSRKGQGFRKINVFLIYLQHFRRRVKDEQNMGHVHLQPQCFSRLFKLLHISFGMK